MWGVAKNHDDTFSGSSGRDLAFSFGWKGFDTFNTPVSMGAVMAPTETGTLSQETTNPDFLLPRRGHAWKERAQGEGQS